MKMKVNSLFKNKTEDPTHFKYSSVHSSTQLYVILTFIHRALNVIFTFMHTALRDIHIHAYSLTSYLHSSIQSYVKFTIIHTLYSNILFIRFLHIHRILFTQFLCLSKSIYIYIMSYKCSKFYIPVALILTLSYIFHLRFVSTG